MQEPQNVEPVAARDPAGRAIRIVVVDDNEDMRLLLRMATESRDDVVIVAEATNGQDAIAIVAALRPDLVVLDVEMPVLDGISALPRLRQVSPTTRVVMLSAITAPEYQQRAVSAGAAAYIPKGTSVLTLVDELLGAADLLDALITALTPAVSETDLPHDASSATRARRFVTSTLTAWGQLQVTQDVELLVSELVTNVIVHTEAAPQVSVRLLPDRVHVEVFDTDPTPVAPRDAELTATSGRGLALVDQLAVAWGSTPTGHGKVVWFDIAR